MLPYKTISTKYHSNTIPTPHKVSHKHHLIPTKSKSQHLIKHIHLHLKIIIPTSNPLTTLINPIVVCAKFQLKIKSHILAPTQYKNNI